MKTPNMCINFNEERTFGNGHCLHEMFVPPMQIFPRTDMNDQLMSGAFDACHTSGWVQPRLFTVWFHHLIARTKRSGESPVSLVLDGHFSSTTFYRFQSS
jgi:hypothetical protein